MGGKGTNFGDLALFAYEKALELSKYFFTTKTAIIIAAVVITLFFLKINLKTLLILAILGTAASFSTIYKRYLRIPSAIELVTFGTVMTSISVGPFIGAAFGATTTLISEIVSSAVDMNTFIYMIARGIIGIVAFYLHSMNIVMLGILMVILFNAISLPIYLLQGDIDVKLKAAYFVAMNLFFNFIVFSLLGSVTLAIVQ